MGLSERDNDVIGFCSAHILLMLHKHQFWPGTVSEVANIMATNAAQKEHDS